MALASCTLVLVQLEKSPQENSVATSLSTKAQVANWLSYGSDKNPYEYSQVFSKN